MCYEFAHPCTSALIKKINILGGESYFLICIGNLNYLYTKDEEVVKKIRGLLFLEQIILHYISGQELKHILAIKETIEFQVFHGNEKLFENFKNE